MNVYDFDKTIYPRDSTADFYFYILARKPAIARFLPGQLYHFVRFKRKKIDKTEFKEKFYVFLTGIDGVENRVARFWDKKEGKIGAWYLSQKKPDDIIISASPEFLLREICRRLGVRLIASRVDSKSGRYTGQNCYGEEKVRRLLTEMPNADVNIDKFYSDSLSDAPLARLAKEAYIVKKRTPFPWIK